MSFPYLDLDGFRARSILPDTDITALEQRYPGWLAQSISSWTSRINAQLRKRYGVGAYAGNALPLGQTPPALLSAGTAPPLCALVGRPTLGSAETIVQITNAGALGFAVLRWSADNGRAWTSGIVSAATVSLWHGLTLAMGVGAYSADNVYYAATPVPETVLLWLTILVTWDAYQKRGRNPQDPLILDLKEDRVRVLAEIAQAADSKDGLFDLPASEDVDSAITTGGPIFYSESSPFVSADRQQCVGTIEDCAGFGSIGSSSGGVQWPNL